MNGKLDDARQKRGLGASLQGKKHRQSETESSGDETATTVTAKRCQISPNLDENLLLAVSRVKPWTAKHGKLSVAWDEITAHVRDTADHLGALASQTMLRRRFESLMALGAQAVHKDATALQKATLLDTLQEIKREKKEHEEDRKEAEELQASRERVGQAFVATGMARASEAIKMRKQAVEAHRHLKEGTSSMPNTPSSTAASQRSSTSPSSKPQAALIKLLGIEEDKQVRVMFQQRAIHEHSETARDEAGAIAPSADAARDASRRIGVPESRRKAPPSRCPRT